MSDGPCTGFTVTELYTILVSIPVLTVAYITLRSLSSSFDGPRRRSWIFQLLSSTVLMLVGMFMAFKIFTRDVEKVPVWTFVWSENAVTRLATSYFMVAMTMDTIIGCFDYLKHMQLLTGWIHHALYLWLCIFTLSNCLTGSVGILYLLEMPTFLFSLGSMFSRFRSDYGFGITFLVTRLIYHYWIVYHAWFGMTEPAHQAVYAFGHLSGLVHLYWGYNWIRGQWRRIMKVTGKDHDAPLNNKSDVAKERLRGPQ